MACATCWPNFSDLGILRHGSSLGSRCQDFICKVRDCSICSVLLTSIWLLVHRGEKKSLKISEPGIKDCTGFASLSHTNHPVNTPKHMLRDDHIPSEVKGLASDSDKLDESKNDFDTAEAEHGEIQSDSNDSDHIETATGDNIGTEMKGNDIHSAETETGAKHEKSSSFTTSSCSLDKINMCRERNIDNATDDKEGHCQEETKRNMLDNNSIIKEQIRDEPVKITENQDIIKLFPNNLETTELETESDPAVFTCKPQGTGRDIDSNLLDSKTHTEDGLQEKYNGISDLNCALDSSVITSEREKSVSKQGISVQQETQSCFNSGSDTIVKTTDGKTFQISSNDGLTFEDSFVIEKVDSDDSDEDVDMEDRESSQLVINAHSSSDNNNPVGSSTEPHIEKRSEVAERNISADTASIESGDAVNAQPYIVSCTEVTEQSVNTSKETVETFNENVGILDKQGNVVKNNLGGIISSDNDTELKIINIAGGVTFYDENEETLCPDKMADYIETKLDHDAQIPFSPHTFTCISGPSSCTSLYSDVVYSTIPGSFMSVDPRLAVHNCPQWFVPSSLNSNMCLANDFGGRVYQQIPNENSFLSGQGNITQGCQQYFTAHVNTPNMLQPVKSESKLMAPSKNLVKSKKKKKSSKGTKTDSERIPVVKEYYNVRDPSSGKFVKIDHVPHVNNLQKFSRSTLKSGIKLETMSGTSSGIISGQNQGCSAKSNDSLRRLLENRTSVLMDKQSSPQSLKQSKKQLVNERKKLDKKLAVLLAKSKGGAKKLLTEKETKLQKSLEKKRVKLLKQLLKEKKKTSGVGKAKTASGCSAPKKTNSLSELEYVVREEGTCVDADGLKQKYTVVTIKGILPKGQELEQQNAAITEVGNVVKQEPQESDQKQTGVGEKKKTPLKGKGKQFLNKSPVKLETVRPVKIMKGVGTQIEQETKVKKGRRKTKSNKVLKIKESHTTVTKQTVTKNKQKPKEKSSTIPVNNTLTESVQPQLVKPELNKSVKVNAGKDKARLNKGKKAIHKVSTLISKRRGRPKKSKKTKRALKELFKKKLDEANDITMLHHGERGAKLAAQQRISAYNESLSSDLAAQGSGSQ